MSAAIAAHRFTLAASPCDVLTLRLERASSSRALSACRLRSRASAERQWAALLAWAEAAGKILALGFPAPVHEGGREHDVSLHEPSGRWIKYTKPSACGFTVSWSDHGQPYLHNAHPLDYLQRLLWQNEALGDDIHLVGLWQARPHRWRIVTPASLPRSSSAASGGSRQSDG